MYTLHLQLRLRARRSASHLTPFVSRVRSVGHRPAHTVRTTRPVCGRALVSVPRVSSSTICLVVPRTAAGFARPDNGSFHTSLSVVKTSKYCTKRIGVQHRPVVVNTHRRLGTASILPVPWVLMLQPSICHLVAMQDQGSSTLSTIGSTDSTRTVHSTPIPTAL